MVDCHAEGERVERILLLARAMNRILEPLLQAKGARNGAAS